MAIPPGRTAQILELEAEREFSGERESDSLCPLVLIRDISDHQSIICGARPSSTATTRKTTRLEARRPWVTVQGHVLSVPSIGSRLLAADLANENEPLDTATARLCSLLFPPPFQR